MKPRIYVPDLRKRVKSAYKSALRDILTPIPQDDVDPQDHTDYHQHMIDSYKQGIRHIDKLVDEQDYFTNRPALESVRAALLYYFASIGLFSFIPPKLKILLDDIDMAVNNKKEAQYEA